MTDPAPSPSPPEIVAPAGDPARLRTALHFGADAVYLGLRRFSMRANAGNFSWDELEWALHHVHGLGRRVYVCLNVQAFDADFEALPAALRRLRQLGPDAVVVSDPGVLAAARAEAPDLPLHISTQASVSNTRAANFWFEAGVRRIVLARELSLEQVSAITAGARGGIEVFAHGAVCVATSGRCLISLYWAGRDPRIGHCAQVCRWPFRALQARDDTEHLHPVEEDARGSYLFDARDLWTLPILPGLLATGAGALKIEGRTRSPHYVGVTTDVYRHAVHRLCAGDRAGFEANRGRYLDQLRHASRRAFSTHFYTGEEHRAQTYTADRHRLGGKQNYLGRVTQNRGDHLLVALSNPLQRGEAVELRDAEMRCEPLQVEALKDREGAELRRALAGQEIQIPGAFQATPGALLLRQPTPLPEPRAIL